MAGTMKITVVRDVMPCSPLNKDYVSEKPAASHVKGSKYL